VRALVVVLLAIAVSGCGVLQLPQTQSEILSGYAYVPVEPSSVNVTCGGGPCSFAQLNTPGNILSKLPDYSVRIATRRLTSSANLNVSGIGSSIGVAGNSYEVTIDFVNTETIDIDFAGKWRVEIDQGVKVAEGRCYPFEASVLEQQFPLAYERWSLKALTFNRSEIEENQRQFTEESRRRCESQREEGEEFFSDCLRPQPSEAEVSLAGASAVDAALSRVIESQAFFYSDNDEWTENGPTLNCGKNGSLNFERRKYGHDEQVPARAIQRLSEPFSVPVYVGIGLRLRALVDVKKGEVNLTSLPALSAAVSAGRVEGSMSVQTLGITGKQARTSLLLLDKIDATTIQNAIQVLAAIKAEIGDESLLLSPRIVGFHNTIGAGSQGINLIHTFLVGSDDIGLELCPEEASRDACATPLAVQ